MESEKVYSLTDGVQVREEKFGLLFYDYRGPRLYFLPSGDLIARDFFDGKHTVAELVELIRAKHDRPTGWISGRVSQVLGLLESKGLVHGQSLC